MFLCSPNRQHQLYPEGKALSSELSTQFSLVASLRMNGAIRFCHPYAFMVWARTTSDVGEACVTVGERRNATENVS